uniref:Beta-1,4-galactosyltransferase 1 n=1 Tax=Erpetoichthys calabaricus TaxID=27687 RepID=A0A8C4S7G6_ERPCA
VALSSNPTGWPGRAGLAYLTCMAGVPVSVGKMTMEISEILDFQAASIRNETNMSNFTCLLTQHCEEKFNRAKLMNIGYTEALKEYDYNCFIFSDVNLIPIDDRNISKCYSQPRHLSAFIDKFGFRLLYSQNFGGVSSFSKEQFKKINGFPNNYWSWGGEDDATCFLIIFCGMNLSRPNKLIGRYHMIAHDKDKKNDPNPHRFDRMNNTRFTMDSDGLNSLNYKVIEVQKQPLYTKVIVDVGTPSL